MRLSGLELITARPWLSFVFVQRFKDSNATEEATAMLSRWEPKLHQFEAASLGNLLPESAEEAKALVPSLKDKVPGIRDSGIDDQTLDELLSDLSDHRKLE